MTKLSSTSNKKTTQSPELLLGNDLSFLSQLANDANTEPVYFLNTRNKVLNYIKSLLQPLYNLRLISREQFVVVAKQTLLFVMASTEMCVRGYSTTFVKRMTQFQLMQVSEKIFGVLMLLSSSRSKLSSPSVLSNDNGSEGIFIGDEFDLTLPQLISSKHANSEEKEEQISSTNAVLLSVLEKLRRHLSTPQLLPPCQQEKKQQQQPSPLPPPKINRTSDFFYSSHLLEEKKAPAVPFRVTTSLNDIATSLTSGFCTDFTFHNNAAYLELLDLWNFGRKEIIREETRCFISLLLEFRQIVVDKLVQYIVSTTEEVTTTALSRTDHSPQPQPPPPPPPKTPPPKVQFEHLYPLINDVNNDNDNNNNNNDNVGGSVNKGGFCHKSVTYLSGDKNIHDNVQENEDGWMVNRAKSIHGSFTSPLRSSKHLTYDDIMSERAPCIGIASKSCSLTQRQRATTTEKAKFTLNMHDSNVFTPKSSSVASLSFLEQQQQQQLFVNMRSSSNAVSFTPRAGESYNTPPNRRDAINLETRFAASSADAARSKSTSLTDKLFTNMECSSTPEKKRQHCDVTIENKEEKDTNDYHIDREDFVNYLQELLQPAFNSGAVSVADLGKIVQRITKQLLGKRTPCTLFGEAEWKQDLSKKVERLLKNALIEK